MFFFFFKCSLTVTELCNCSLLSHKVLNTASVHAAPLTMFLVNLSHYSKLLKCKEGRTPDLILVFSFSLHLFLPPSLSMWRNKPIRTMSSILTFPQRATHSSHNTTVPSLPFTLPSFTFFTSLCYRSPLESYLDPLCLPYRSAPAHHTHRQTKSSISPGKRC